MSIIRREAPPPTESWDALREWSRHTWWERYRASLLVMLPFTTLVIGLATVALFFAEFSLRSAKLMAIIWAIAVPVTALGYMRKMSRAAAQVPPISPASLDPNTAVDIRSSRPEPPN
ncbi:MAG TPA: hypothetical protein PK586_00415 [Casimicrobium sp.]|nr:hypothetical protein [Casimicrobium sp.]